MSIWSIDLNYIISLDLCKTSAAIIILQLVVKSQQILILESQRKEDNIKTALVCNTDPYDSAYLLDTLSGQIYFDGIPFFCTTIPKGLFFIFMAHFAFGLSYNKEICKLMLCIEKYIMEWNVHSILDNEDVSFIGDRLLYN